MGIHSNYSGHLDSPLFLRADQDSEFLLRDEWHAVRLQCEWFQPELIQQDEGIDFTIVVF